MNLMTWLYLFEVLHNLDCVLGNMVGISIIVTILTSCLWLPMQDTDMVSDSFRDRYNSFYKAWVAKWWVLAIVVIVLVFIPSKQTMYLMAGSKWLSDSTIPVKVSEALNLKLDDVIAELQNKGHVKP